MFDRSAQGSETFLDEMEWSGSKGWKTANRGLWMVADQVAGYSKVHKDLAFIVVVNSGHLVPNNVPVQALDLITRFVTDEDFLDISLPSFNAPKHPAKKAELAPRFHFIHLLAVALVCFFCGILTSTYRARKKQHAYSRISDVALSTSMCASH